MNTYELMGSESLTMDKVLEEITAAIASEPQVAEDVENALSYLIGYSLLTRMD